MVVVTRSSPNTSSSLSRMRAAVASSRLVMLRVASNSSSPCSVRIRPRAWRRKSVVLRLSSSARIWRLTADWLRCSVSPAWVRLPASATAWKIRSLSQSISLASMVPLAPPMYVV